MFGIVRGRVVAAAGVRHALAVRSAPIDAALASFAATVRARLGVRLRELVLFGSQAHGTARGDPDVDVLVALLLSRAEEPRTHASAIPLFNTEVVKQGALPGMHNRILGACNARATSRTTTPP